MSKWNFTTIVFVFSFFLKAQETTLPVDLRQHNLTEFNSSLFNPVFSLDRNTPNSIALWSRWQWQDIDGDPSTTFVNYTHSISARSSASAGFFQHNTGIFSHTGGVLNYAYRFNIGTNTQLAVGLNVFGFQQELSDDRFQPNPDLPLPELQVSNSFILQFAPGVRLTSNGFGIGLASENLFDYDFSESESVTRSSEKIYMGMLSYDIPLVFGDALGNSYLQPNLYVKTIPNEDTQYGISTILSTSRFWAQSGFNSFYGISVGGGGRLFQKLSLGAMVEFGTKEEIKDNDPSFEVLLAYHLKEPKKEGLDLEDENEARLLEEKEIAKAEQLKNKLVEEEARKADREAKKLAAVEEKQRKVRLKDSLYNAKRSEALAVSERLNQQRIDSINSVKEKDAAAMAKRIKEEKRQDSIQKVQLAEAEEALKKSEKDELAEAVKKEQPKTTGRYEEVSNEDGLAPGYYLVANVFGTKKYFESFMATLKAKGLNPKSFYRNANKYNYVYLERYDTLKEAEMARDSKFSGKYSDTTWIFRVME